MKISDLARQIKEQSLTKDQLEACYSDLTFEEFNLKHTPEADDEIREMAAKLLTQASTFWYDHYLSKMN